MRQPKEHTHRAEQIAFELCCPGLAPIGILMAGLYSAPSVMAETPPLYHIGYNKDQETEFPKVEHLGIVNNDGIITETGCLTHPSHNVSCSCCSLET